MDDFTRKFDAAQDKDEQIHFILTSVYEALKEKGYDPINQIVGYLISGDPTYITSHNNARYLIRRLERDELLEEFIRFYIKSHEGGKAAE